MRKANKIIENLRSDHPLTWQRGHLQRRGHVDCDLFGKQKDKINECYERAQKSIIVVLGWHPCGKTTILCDWLDKLETQGKACFCWSFRPEFEPGITSSQEQSQLLDVRLLKGYQASPDEFFSEAFKYLNSNNTALVSTWDKGRKLAEELKEAIIKAQNTGLIESQFILVLDGLDCYQYIAEYDQNYGQIRDHSLKCFIEQIAGMKEVFCVITSRVKLELKVSVPDSKRLEQIDLEEMDLEPVDVYRYLGDKVSGLTRKIAEIGNPDIRITRNPMFLRYLVDLLNSTGDPMDELKKFDAKFADDMSLLFDMLYNKLGYFSKVVMLLLASVRIPIKGYHIKKFYDTDKYKAIFREVAAECKEEELEVQDVMIGLRTILKNYSSLITIIPLDNKTHGNEFNTDNDKFMIHQLQRQWIEKKMRTYGPLNHNAQGFTTSLYHAIHEKLYEYCKIESSNNTETEQDRLTWQLAAVRHLCLAGKQTDAWIYFWTKVRHGIDHRPGNDFGLWNDDLAVLQYFFGESYAWSYLSPNLEESMYAHVLTEVGFDLRVVGRTDESLKVLNQALAEALQRVSLKKPYPAEVDNPEIKFPSLAEVACIAAGNLSKSYLLLGEIDSAIEAARKSARYADEHRKNTKTIDNTLNEDNVMVMASRCWLGEALHYAGLLWEADTEFRYAKDFWKKSLGKDLEGTNFFRYCELSLDRASYQLYHWAEKSLDEGNSKTNLADKDIRKIREEVAMKIQQAIHASWRGNYRRMIFNRALYRFIGGRTYLIDYDLKLQKFKQKEQTILSGSYSELERLLIKARNSLSKSVNELQQIGHQIYFARALLQMAGLWRRMAELVVINAKVPTKPHQDYIKSKQPMLSETPKDYLGKAKSMLIYSLDVITKSSMIALESDYHLENAHFHWISHKAAVEYYHRRQAILAIHDAKYVANKCAYRRKLAELYDLECEIMSTFPATHSHQSMA